VPTLPVLANNGAMSQFVGAFEVTSMLKGHVYDCSFSHIWNAIATRHADTIDAKFVIDGEGHIVGLAHPAFIEFRSKAGRDLTDREASFVAAEYLRERLEEEDLRPLYDVTHEEVTRLVQQVGIK
jgi:GTP-sensing pleiotropic transcriptional regulator CodY